ncbi:acyltransferase family protein [Desulfatiferula olefinivorans]
MCKLNSEIIIIKGGKYYQEIDFIKSIAILFVIVLHSISIELKLDVLAPFHMWHAVPIFMLIAGINSRLYILREGYAPFKEYSFEQLKKKGTRVLIPFGFVLTVEFFIIYFYKGHMEDSLFTFILSGGYGAGSYFVPVFIQHLLFFPLVLIFLNKSKMSFFSKMAVLFCVSILLEKICIFFFISEDLYCLLYVRYFFAAALGAMLLDSKLRVYHMIILALISFIYIFYTSYFGYQISFIYPAWIFQHAPAYFWTLMFVLLLWFLHSKLGLVSEKLSEIGRYSYHIFLFQMVYFWSVDVFVKNAVIKYITPHYFLIYTAINCAMCVMGGLLFFKMNHILNEEFYRRFMSNNIPRNN